MTKQTNVSIRKIDNGWIYSITTHDPSGLGFGQEEHYADTLESVFDQLRRKVGDQAKKGTADADQNPFRKPIPYPLSGAGYYQYWSSYYDQHNVAGWDTATPTEGPDKESDYFYDPRSDSQKEIDRVIGQALCNVFPFSQDKPKEEPDVLASFKEIWGTK